MKNLYLNFHMFFAMRSVSWQHLWKNTQTMLGAALMLVLFLPHIGKAQIEYAGAAACVSGTSNPWLTAANWCGGAVPGVSAHAQFTAKGTGGALTVGINMNGATNNGANNQGVGAIEVASGGSVRTITNSSGATAGTLTLAGITINAVNNVIIRNNSANLLSFTNGAAGMSMFLGNATNNIINVDGAGGITIANNIVGGAKNLTKAGAGAGVLTLTSVANTYTGVTTVSTGNLRLNPTANATHASQIVLTTGSTLSTTGITATRTWTSSSTLDVAGNSTLALAAATNHTLSFANSSGVTWAGTTLTVTGWAGTAGSSGTGGKLFFGNDATGITGTQLGKISFTGFPGTPIILSTGEVVPPGPNLSPNVGTLTGFSYLVGAGPSTSQTVNLTGSSLSPAAGNITISESTDYEVSDDNSTFGASATIAYTGSALASTPFYVRLKAGRSTGAYNGQTISISGGGATASVTASGDVAGPTIVASGTLTKSFTNVGFASDEKQITVSGTNLGANPVTVTLAGYAFATVATGPYTASPFSIASVAGTVASTTVYVRLTGASTGVYNGNIAVTSPASGANTVNIATTGEVYAAGSTFTAGNIVALTLGEGGAVPLSTASTPGFLTEFTSAGAQIQQVALPFTNKNGSNKRLSLSGSSTTEGSMSLSPDGKYLTLVGYDVPLGTTAVAGTTIANPGTPTATNTRVAATVQQNAVFNSTAFISDAFGGNNARSAVTLDGSQFWMSTNNGLRTVVPNINGTSTSIVSPGNTRVLVLNNSTLTVSSQSGANGYTIGINSLGNLPSGTVTPSLISGLTSSDPYGYFFFDRDPAVSGNDLVYVANNTAGLLKYSYNGTTWTARGSITTVGNAVTSITGAVNGPDIDLYVTVGTAAGNIIKRVTDAAAYNANITNNGSAITGVGTLIATAPANQVFRSVAFAPVNNPDPTIGLIFSSPVSGNVAQGSAGNPVYQIQVDATIGNATLSGLNLTTNGNYQIGDVDAFKLYESTDATFDGGDAFLSTVASTGNAGETINFTGLAQAININTTKYYFVVADISGCAVVGRTFGIASTPLANVSFIAGNKIGTPVAGNTQTFIVGTPANVTALSASNNTPNAAINWTNPSCFTSILVVAHTSTISSSPLSPTYTGNTNYSLAPAFPGGGKVVFFGSGNSTLVTGLALETNYFYKVFVKIGSVWSSGSEVSAYANATVYYSRASGNANSGAIWSLTPGGAPATAASLGGFATNVTIRVQSGNTVEISSGFPVYNVIIDAGGKLWRNDNTPGGMQYISLNNDLTCNGILGNGATFDAIGFNIEGLNCDIGGIGNLDFGRVRKSTTTNPTSTVNFNQNARIWFPGAALYSNVNTSKFNVNVAYGKTLTIADPAGDLSMNGFNGLDVGNRAGDLTINGTLNVAGTLYARNSNPGVGYGVNITLGSAGVINTPNLTADLTLGQGTTVSLASGSRVNITGTLTVTTGTINSNGAIRLISNSSGTARIGTSGGLITGNVIVERYIPSFGWHFLGTAVAGQTVADWNDDIITQGPMPGVSIPNPGSNTSSIFLFNQAGTINDNYGQINGWEVPTSSALTQYEGYRVHVQGPKIIDNVGAITLGSKTLNLNHSGATAYTGYNIVMNPHLSAIDWTLVTKNNTANTAMVYNPTASTYQYFGSPIGVVPLNNAINPIASGQGFMVKATAPGANIIIPESAKSVLSGTFFRSAVSENDRIRISFKDASSNTTDETLFQFMDGTTAEFDAEFDATKFENPGMNVYTITPDFKQMAINALPFTGVQMVVPVGVKTATAGTFSLSVQGVENLVVASHVYLRDFETGALINLATTPVYNFQIGAAGELNNRFELIFTPQTVTEVKANLLNTGMRVFPNPASGSTFNVTVEKGKATSATLWIEDLAGRKVANQLVTLTNSNTFSVTKPANAGVYVVRMRLDGKVTSQKLIVQ